MSPTTESMGILVMGQIGLSVQHPKSPICSDISPLSYAWQG